MDPPLVHVLIINWNGVEHLEACLSSLLAGTYPHARYVLLDNASTDNSVAFARERFGHDGRLEIVEFKRNLGWSGCNNVGIQRALDAGAKYVMLINNDTRTAIDAVEKLVAAAEAAPDAGALAPKMLLYHQPDLLNSLGIEASVAGNGWDRGIGRLDGPAWDEPAEVLGACGGACLYRAEALRKTGLLPEDYEIYLDDLDLSLRIWNAGYQVRSCPAARVRHKFSATMGEGRRARHKYYLNTRNRFRLALRLFPAARFPAWAWAFTRAECRAVGRALLDGVPWRAVAHLRAWAAAVAYLPAALGARRAFRKRGLQSGGFWRLIRPAPLFFPGIPLPEDGWYSREPDDEGESLRPMAATAEFTVASGALRVSCADCYPSIARLDVRVLQHGRTLAHLRGPDQLEAEFPVEAGEVVFVAASRYPAESTGRTHDVGAWLTLESVPAGAPTEPS